MDDNLNLGWQFLQATGAVGLQTLAATADFVGRYGLTPYVIGGLALGYVAYKTRSEIHKGMLNGNSMVIGETEYIPSTESMPSNDKSTSPEKCFVNQRMRTDQAKVDLNVVFDCAKRRAIIRYIKEAAKLCTSDEPIIFQHLPSVIADKKERTEIMELVSRQWKNYFSEYLRKGLNPQSVYLNSGEYREEIEKIPVLLYEESAHFKQFRTQIVQRNIIEVNSLPKIEQVCIETAIGKFERNPEHHHNQRLVTMWGVKRTLMANIDKWSHDYGVAVPTGRILSAISPTI